MTVSSLDPKPALLVVDLQKGLVGLPTAHPFDGVVGNAVALAEKRPSSVDPTVRSQR